LPYPHLLVAATFAKTAPRATRGPLLPLAILAGCAALAVVTTVSPAVAGALAAVAGVAAVTTAMTRGVHVPALVWPALALPGVAVTALWPTAGFVVAAVMAITVLAVRAPAYAFLGALLLFGFEGSIKMRLSVEGAPSALALGAALIDIALVVSVLGLVSGDRGRPLQRLWARFGRAERLVVYALLAWVVLAVLQIPLGGSLANGVEGFRLVHFYVFAALGGVLLAVYLTPDRAGLMLLLVIAVISGYAAFRGVVGPTENEREFAESRSLGTSFNEHARDTGSFTSHVALVSFLVPAGVFALVLACLQASRRVFAGAVFALTMVGVIASYVRTALVAIIAGAVAFAAMLIGGAGVSRRLKLFASGLIVVLLAGGYGATLLAAEVDPIAKERAESLADPFSDYSVTERLKTWEQSFDTVVSEPLGTGTGTIGRATAKGSRDAVYTDNTYIKILQEQGFLGGIVFLLGIVGALALCWRRLARTGPLERPVGVAALLGVTAFLVLALSGEFIEQPGKALVWALLGVATWDAFGR
jgi:O-antigen ligase